MCAPQSESLRDVHSYIEKREEGDRGGQEDKGGCQKERDPASNQFSNCSPHPEHTMRFTELGREKKRKGREEIEVTWSRKRRVQRGREQSSQ